ncbi:DUF4367 domain-containing protein [Desulfosporosinus sp. OT]|uniref:DUF4367 domain-containing protein n=1 Tax=Desulfosporosinus sp. OT TaxID=913865 RepID=UPI000223A1D8|nr:DUF4367 domain-containing protein [Desulfosporosinus sp. OT]EGW37200.1 hypothetical protein DOT_4739 [Desulfosporosinus sp. OT]
MIEHEIAKIKAQEKMMEALFEYAAVCHVENIILENPCEADSDPEISLTQEFDHKMKKLIASYNRKYLIKSLRQKTFMFLPKVVVFMLIVLGSLTIIVASVHALRAKALNLFLDIQEKYTDIQMKEINPNQTEQKRQITPTQKEIPSNWNGYVPEYVPKGFIVVKTEENVVSMSIHYADDKGRTIRFNQYLNCDTDLRIDTENATLQHIFIHNSQALIFEKNGRVGVVWEDQSLFYIVGQAEQSEIIKMAKSLNK